MNHEDIKEICKVLVKRGRRDLADILSNGQGEVDESSSYGSYLFSTISQYLFFLNLDRFHQARELSEDDKNIILESVLYLYPHQAEAPEIRSIDFRLLRGTTTSEDIILPESEFDTDFTREQISKCKDKITKEDYDGAISSAGSLLESVFADIYKKCTNKDIGRTSDLVTSYKKVKHLIKLSDEQYTDEAARGIMRGLTSIVAGIDIIRNRMGDRHRRLSKPWERHAKVCVNAVNTIVDFLYQTLQARTQELESLRDELINFLNSNKRLLDKEQLLQDQYVVSYVARLDEFLRNLVKRDFIVNYDISSYRQSDIFFAAMGIFFENLTSEDIGQIYEKQKDNEQACGLLGFLKLVHDEKPEMITKSVSQYIEEEEKKASVSVNI